MIKSSIFCIILIAAVKLCKGANLLALIPFSAKSHHNFIRPILIELAKNGHRITLYTSLPMDKNVTNIKEIIIEDPKKDLSKDVESFEKLRQWGETPIFAPSMLWFFGLYIMNNTLSQPNFQRLINSGEKYDLILTETHFLHEPMLAFGHKFGAPVVSLNTFPSYFYVDEFLGNPLCASYIPAIDVYYTDQMTFFQRVHNIIRLSVHLLGTYLYYLPKVDALISEHFKYKGAEPIPPVMNMLENVSLVLTNSHYSIEYPRPLVSNIVGVAGLHISPIRKPLPQDLKTFMDEAKDGVVYFSLGSVVPSDQMPEDMKNAFVKAFGKIKQRVIWKLPVETFPSLPKNVKLGKWFPQEDLLAHPNCKLFITHGGLLSQIEAIYFGVPLISIPIFAEQYLNANRALHRGFSVTLNSYNITEESVLWALNEIINKPSYAEKARKYSSILHENPMPPLEKAVYWINYILKFNGAPHLRSEGRKLPYYKYLSLDVIAFIAFVVIFIVIVLYVVSKFLLSLIYNKNKSTNKNIKSSKNKTN